MKRALKKVDEHRHIIGLYSLLFIIGSVSVYDIYWSFRVQEELFQIEKNPIGKWLIEIDNGSIALFMTLKTVGTLVILSAIPLLYFFRKWWGMFAAIVLAIIQFLVFLYLTYGA